MSLEPELCRHGDAAHLASGDQLAIEADKLVAWDGDSQVYYIQRIEEVCPNLQLAGLSEWNNSKDCQIQVCESWGRADVASGVAQFKRPRLRDCSRVVVEEFWMRHCRCRLNSAPFLI